MKKRKDPRINASNLSAKSYLVILLLCNIFCATLIKVYSSIHVHMGGVSHKETFLEAAPVALAVGGYVFLVSVVTSLIMVCWKRHIVRTKFGVLSEAARKVASGNYAVRIQPQRHDGRKDEFEVLYEDFNTMADYRERKTILREDFLSNISHEFKTPLSVINNYVTILQSGILSVEESDEYLERVRVTSGQLSDMVGDILLIGRLENGKILPEMKNYDLSEQLVQTILSFDHKLAEKNISLATEWKDSIQIHSDAGLLQIVWNNLVSNAIKFTPEHGQISVSITEKGKTFQVSVKDNGCGIPEKDLGRIFEKFYQADHAHATQGNGLGLAMVQSIVNLLDCRIFVNSKINEGTEFVLSFPKNSQ